MRFKKERQDLVFRIQSNIYYIPFLQKQLTTKSFIVDTLSGFKYPSDERNNHFSFQIKATLKATTLGIRMCSTELLHWKIRKVRHVTPSRYLNRTPSLTFSSKYSIFFGQAISRNSSKPLIVKGFYLFRMSNDYCFRGILEKWDPGPRTLRLDLKVRP